MFPVKKLFELMIKTKKLGIFESIKNKNLLGGFTDGLLTGVFEKPPLVLGLVLRPKICSRFFTLSEVRAAGSGLDQFL